MASSSYYDKRESSPLLSDKSSVLYTEANDRYSTQSNGSGLDDDSSSFLENSRYSGVRFRGLRTRADSGFRPFGKPKIGSTDQLSSKYESLDYDQVENWVYLKEERKTGLKSSRILRIELARWVVMLLIGMITAMIATIIDVCINLIADWKYGLVGEYLETHKEGSLISKPFFIWLAIDVGLVSIAAILTAYLEPVAAGSGVPQIKCYLNGVKVPRVVRVKTLLCKVIGVIFSVSGGLAVGKEGPMIHSGSVVAAGISQGRSTTFKMDLKMFQYFREDHEKRDFVSGGAAAGVAAAFGAPVGGVLFSLEEGASFWNQSLTWRIFFASMTSTFTLNVLLSYYHGTPWSLSSPGLVNFGQFANQSYYGYEIPIFFLMGVIGGLLGAVFNAINYRLTVYRIKFVHQRFLCVLEAAVVASFTMSTAFLSIYFSKDCRPIVSTIKHPIQLFCDDGQYSASANLFFSLPEESVKSLFHKDAGTYEVTTLVVFFIIYFLLACWTYGISVPSGLFIPSLLAGAAWGRMFGIFLHSIFPDDFKLSELGIYALIGAAAQLGGVIRMTISLTVILIEATGNITYGLPLMVVLMIAKWIGDIFNHGLYDIHIQLMRVPLLAWQPPPMSTTIRAMEVMSHPVTTLNVVEKVGNIMDVLSDPTTNHNGFPVVDPHEQESFGTFRGLILRSQLIVLLQHKAFSMWPVVQDPRVLLGIEDFRDAYPRYPDINDLNISEVEMECTIDLRPFMNPSPYTVQKDASLPRIFRLFRALGLRHLVVTDKSSEVIGIVTRKDLARYRYTSRGGRVTIQELDIVDG
ncbi:H(+)/Cl(-) exchange transporter 7-like [Amphiura filiformis]|uniref:H(+)/Cl(-) exchange transporter 7-like n=1 Tax=Amphiura filiformis TaxID=82378 RepID=UPI003B2260C9